VTNTVLQGYNYVTNSSLTTTLTSYVTNSSLTTTLLDYASKSAANTYTALQTFNSGLTVPSGQTLTCAGTLTGGAITATTQTIGNNATNVATTAFVNNYVVPTITNQVSAGTITYSPVSMRGVFVYCPSTALTTNLVVSLNNPASTYIGQTVTFVNFNTGTGLFQIQPVGSGNYLYYNGNYYPNGTPISIAKYTCRTFVYIGNTIPNNTGHQWVSL
jgi:hypothetical protein